MEFPDPQYYSVRCAASDQGRAIESSILYHSGQSNAPKKLQKQAWRLQPSTHCCFPSNWCPDLSISIAIYIAPTVCMALYLDTHFGISFPMVSSCYLLVNLLCFLLPGERMSQQGKEWTLGWYILEEENMCKIYGWDPSIHGSDLPMAKIFPASLFHCSLPLPPLKICSWELEYCGGTSPSERGVITQNDHPFLYENGHVFHFIILFITSHFLYTLWHRCFDLEKKGLCNATSHTQDSKEIFTPRTSLFLTIFTIIPKLYLPFLIAFHWEPWLPATSIK